jgi:hypothetical protein
VVLENVLKRSEVGRIKQCIKRSIGKRRKGRIGRCYTRRTKQLYELVVVITKYDQKKKKANYD